MNTSPVRTVKTINTYLLLSNDFIWTYFLKIKYWLKMIVEVVRAVLRMTLRNVLKKYWK